MTTTEAHIENLKKDLVFLSRIAGDIISEDYEEIDALHRTIRRMSEELFELELSLQPETDEDGHLIAA